MLCSRHGSVHFDREGASHRERHAASVEDAGAGTRGNRTAEHINGRRRTGPAQCGSGQNDGEAEN